jgi:hypothetical protein
MASPIFPGPRNLLYLSLLFAGCSSIELASWDGQICTETYTEQPLLVDVWLDPAPQSTASLTIPLIKGVRVEELGHDIDGRAGFRVRGLPPEKALEVEVHIRDETYTETFETPPPLEGFIPWFRVMTEGEHYEGYRLFDISAWPLIGSGGAFVVDSKGITRFYLPLYPASMMNHAAVPSGLQLLEDGSLLFIQDDAIQIVNEFGHRTLYIAAADVGLREFHHDVVLLPGGNFMTMSRSYRELSSEDGKVEIVCSDTIAEISPEGVLVWQWDSFDHLDPERTVGGPGLADYPVLHPDTGEEVRDWTHANALVYREDDRSILLSLRHQNWVILIDHSSGRVLWRLGAEGDFDLDMGGSWFHHQHAPEWQEDGSLLLYDNGINIPDVDLNDWRSRSVRYSLDETLWTATEVWTEGDLGYHSLVAGDADRLPNGNIQVVDATLPFAADQFFPTQSRIREVDPDTGEWMWWLDGPDFQFIYRAMGIERLPGEATSDYSQRRSLQSRAPR